MARHIRLGKDGEQMAERHLIEKGYVILHRNWRHSHYEIDIIALKGRVLHFVEVKIRSSKIFGLPEEAVTKKKFRFLQNAADEFLFQHPQYRHVQYDVLAITIFKDQPVDYFLIEDVYL
jgi:putative endonuclease